MAAITALNVSANAPARGPEAPVDANQKSAVSPRDSATPPPVTTPVALDVTAPPPAIEVEALRSQVSSTDSGAAVHARRDVDNAESNNPVRIGVRARLEASSQVVQSTSGAKS